MRPLGFLLAIVTGSTVALSIGLLLTWVVILFLPEDEAQFAPEPGRPCSATLPTLFRPVHPDGHAEHGDCREVRQETPRARPDGELPVEAGCCGCGEQ